QNQKVLSCLSRGNRHVAVIAPIDSVPDPYYRCGCHPEIVERLWEQLGASLPTDCRCLVYGTPALVHPKAGAILAIGLVTQYGLYLPGSLSTAAINAGAKAHTVWSNGGEMDIRRNLGSDWVFVCWLPDKLIWCKDVYELFG